MRNPLLVLLAGVFIVIMFIMILAGIVGGAIIPTSNQGFTSPAEKFLTVYRGNVKGGASQ
jgi:hypothetical protein